MNEIPMTKIYNVSVILDKKDYFTHQTWTFLNFEDRDNFLDYLADLSNDYDFEVDEDEYWANSLDGAKKELDEFLGVDNEDKGEL